MVKLRLFLTVALVTAASVQTFAGWRIVIDKNCIKVVVPSPFKKNLKQGGPRQYGFPETD